MVDIGRLQPRGSSRPDTTNSLPQLWAAYAASSPAGRFGRTYRRFGRRPVTSESASGQSRHSDCAPMTFAVGTRVTSRPPHRSVRAQFGHTAPTLGV